MEAGDTEIREWLMYTLRLTGLGGRRTTADVPPVDPQAVAIAPLSAIAPIVLMRILDPVLLSGTVPAAYRLVGQSTGNPI
jgi:hypothetical protein